MLRTDGRQVFPVASKLVILDEIQRRAGQFLLLGSASMDLMRQSSESLAGRISYLEMGGLNVAEINAKQADRLTLWLRGGFPNSYLSIVPNRTEIYFYRTAAGAEVDLVLKMPSSEIWAIAIKHGVAPKIGKHYNQTCDDVGVTHKFILYGGEDEFPVGNDVQMISLPRLMESIQSG